MVSSITMVIAGKKTAWIFIVALHLKKWDLDAMWKPVELTALVLYQVGVRRVHVVQRKNAINELIVSFLVWTSKVYFNRKSFSEKYHVSPELRNLSSISKDKLFLCASGDEIRPFGDRCNIEANCDDQSDEWNCDHCE